jgi:hypothetical protein
MATVELNTTIMMSYADMARTLNEWMRRYIRDPERFSREFESVQEFLAQKAMGREPSYGEVCSAYQFKLLEEINHAG